VIIVFPLFPGYHALSHKHDRPLEDDIVMEMKSQEKKAFEMPELLHNLDLLVEMSEDAIISNDRK
jgi:tuftelin-interacting protein 11